MSDESWMVRARRGAYTAEAAAHKSFPMNWAVKGLLPASGATVLFGAGSTGKTQLLLWLAAHIASRGPNKPKTWLGAEVRTTGQILVLSAEDIEEDLFRRIGDIAWWMAEEQTGWTEEEVRDVCSRIHVMPFLSMSTAAYPSRNPSLFERGSDGDWMPTSSLDHIERFLDEWNAQADAEDRPDDRFVGVILDSAVSMAGFELSQSEATTNFLFHLNRMSRRQKMFWTIIGHTPKDANKKTDDPAVERLRGSAMWSTTPRTVIELRCATSNDNVEQVVTRYSGLQTRDVLFLSIAKANSLGADMNPYALMRVKDKGAFVNITDQFPGIFERTVKTPGESERPERRAPTDQDRTWLAIIDIIAAITVGGQRDALFTRREIRDDFELKQPHDERLQYVSADHDSKHSRTNFTLAWYLFQLREFGAIADKKKTGQFAVVDLEIARSRFRQPSPAQSQVYAAGEEGDRGPGDTASGPRPEGEADEGRLLPLPLED